MGRVLFLNCWMVVDNTRIVMGEYFNLYKLNIGQLYVTTVTVFGGFRLATVYLSDRK